MTDVPDYVPPAGAPTQAVHTAPAPSAQWQGLSQDQLNSLRSRLVESIIQVVVKAVTGIFVPGGGVGGAANQLTSWANGIPILGTIVQAITGVFGNLTDLTNFFNLSGPSNLLSGLINGVVGGSGNPISSLISSLLGTQSTASTAGTNATTALGNWTSVLGGIPGVSTIAGFLGFLQPTTSTSGIFAPLINGIVGGTTNPLSSLLSSLLGTQSTASTANTNASTALGNWTSVLGGIPGVSTIAGFLGFLQPTTSTSGIFAPLINGVTGGTTNPLSSLLSSLTGTASTASTANTNVNSLISGLLSTPSTLLGFLNDDRVPGLPGLMDALFGGFSGAVSSGATQTNVNTATASQADATAGNSALIVQLQAALGAGTPDSDDFERATLGTAWTFGSSTGTGTIPDAHNFHFSGTGTAEYVMRKNDIIASTDHITSTIVLNQAIPTSLIAVPPFGGNIDVWVRQTAFTTYATRTGVRLRIKSNVLSAAYTLYWVNSGTATTLTSGSCPVPAAGGIISLEAGASANPRKFVGALNGTPFMDFNDTGLVTTIDALNRYRGFGGIGASGLGFSTGTPDIRQWTAQG